MNLLSEKDVSETFFWYVRRNFRNQAEAAKKYQCSISFISAVVNGKKQPTAKMLVDIGLKKVTGYVAA